MIQKNIQHCIQREQMNGIPHDGELLQATKASLFFDLKPKQMERLVSISP
jgi:hypothetical protein